MFTVEANSKSNYKRWWRICHHFMERF